MPLSRGAWAGACAGGGGRRAMKVHVRVPATSANLGAGFDALGLALALHNDVYVEAAPRTIVTVEGEGTGRLPATERNVVVRGIRLVYDQLGRAHEGWSVRCVNRIPPARGLGSSAAAWVGGIVAGN